MGNTMTKAQAYANRQNALKNIGKVQKVADKVSINDVHGAHITVWLGHRRIEWWPGRGKWASGGPGMPADHVGNLEAFVLWLASQDGQASDDDVILIE